MPANQFLVLFINQLNPLLILCAKKL